jgi:hypothetical protein
MKGLLATSCVSVLLIAFMAADAQACHRRGGCCCNYCCYSSCCNNCCSGGAVAAVAVTLVAPAAGMEAAIMVRAATIRAAPGQPPGPETGVNAHPCRVIGLATGHQKSPEAEPDSAHHCKGRQGMLKYWRSLAPRFVYGPRSANGNFGVGTTHQWQPQE